MVAIPIVPERTLEDRVRDFLVDRFLQGDDREFSDSLDLVEARVLTSLNVLQLVDFLEEEFDITLLPEDVFQLTSVDNIARIARGKIK